MRLVILEQLDQQQTPECQEPTTGAFAQRVYGEMEPVTRWDHIYCFPFKKFNGAAGEIFQEIDTILRPGPPYAILLDVDKCPAAGLAWLAQWVGVVVPTKYNEQQTRDYIKGTANWRRGTPAAIIAATKTHLTGEKHVVLRERWTGDAYKLQVITRTAETPDPPTTFEDILTQKPGAIILNYLVIAGQDYQELYDTHADYNAVFAGYITYEGTFEGNPSV